MPLFKIVVNDFGHYEPKENIDTDLLNKNRYHASVYKTSDEMYVPKQKGASIREVLSKVVDLMEAKEK